MRFIVAAIVALAFVSTAQADSSYLHVGEAKLLASKVAVSLQHKVKASSASLGACTRQSSQHLTCAGQLGRPNEKCLFKVVVAKTAASISARSFDYYCVAA